MSEPYLKHEVPRRRTGVTSVYCRTCGREIARAAQIAIRSISKCAYCVLLEQGVKNPEDYVLAQYIQSDPSKPPVPLTAEGEDSVFVLFPEEKTEGPPLQSGGIMGTVKALFRAVGFGRQPEGAPAESRKAAVRRRKSSLRD